MSPENQFDSWRVAVTAAEIAQLTLGCWADKKPGSTEVAYCHTCDDTEARLVVQQCYLDVAHRCVVAAGKCQRCGSDMLVSFGILDTRLLDKFLLE